MRHNLALPLLACGLLVIGCVEPTGPPEAQDPEAAFARGGRPFLPGEQQPVVDDTLPLLFLWPEDDGQNLAQTFSPPKNQLLGFLELPVGCDPGVLLNVKIREGLDGPILYEVNVDGLPMPITAFQLLQVYDPEVSRGTRIRKDRTYAFELASFPRDPINGPFNCYHSQGPVGDSYLRGAGFFEDVPINGPGWLPLTPSEDLPFRTLVR